MKFSKLLTTAMMSVALVASSSAFAAEETPWWSMDFDGLAIEEGGTLTNALNAAYATTQNGWWTSEEGDLTTFENDKLKLNTQGTDLTWTPNADNDTTAITYIDADVTFVGSDTAPTISEKDVHTAVYLKNIVDDTTGEVTNSVLCAYGKTRTDSVPKWRDLTGVELEDGGTYNLRIMLDENNLTFFINDVALTGVEQIYSAKDGYAGAVDSVSFRGTGYVDNFAASQEVKESAGTATIVASALLNDGTIDETLYMWCDPTVLVESINLDETTPQAVRDLIPAVIDLGLSDFVEGGALSAMGVSINGGSERLIAYNEGFPTDDLFSFESGDYISVYIDPTALSKDDVVTVVFYYGTHTATEPDPKPVQLDPPSVTATTTANSVTLTWDADANATGYEVTFNGETTTVTDATSFTASDLTASTDYSYSVVAKGDGVNYTDSEAASGTATTAAAEVTVVEPDPIKISAISGPVEGNVVVTVVPATEGGKIKAGVNYWAVVSATLGGDSIAQEPVTVPEDTDSLQITVPATGDSLFIKVKADTATAK